VTFKFNAASVNDLNLYKDKYVSGRAIEKWGRQVV
jgi:hypothetical protein